MFYHFILLNEKKISKLPFPLVMSRVIAPNKSHGCFLMLMLSWLNWKNFQFME